MMMTTDPRGNERTLWEGRPSIWNWWVSLAIADLLILLALALWWTDRAQYAPYALAGSGLFYLGVFFTRMGSRYTLTTHRAISRHGLFSRRHDEAEIQDIRNISLEQSFFQRLVGIGDIGLSTAGGDGVEVSFLGVGDATQIKERIRSARIHPPPSPAATQ